jgi:hypothetical protein
MSDEKITRLHDDGLPPDLAARLDARLAALPLDVEPPAGNFDAIAERLPQRRPSEAVGGGGKWGGFALAASVAACAVIVTLNVGRGPGTDSPLVAEAPAGPEAIAADPAAEATAATIAARDRYRTAMLPGALGGRAALGAGFLQVREDLSEDFASRLDKLDPATREVVETNLQVIHGALSRIEGALAADPDDPVLQDLLMSTYRQELDYMGRVNQMPAGPEGSMEL